MSSERRYIPIGTEAKLDLILDELLALKGRLSSIESRLAAQQSQENNQTKKKDTNFGFPETHE